MIDATSDPRIIMNTCHAVWNVAHDEKTHILRALSAKRRKKERAGHLS